MTGVAEPEAADHQPHTACDPPRSDLQKQGWMARAWHIREIVR
jgi:hypothetical protein